MLDSILSHDIKIKWHENFKILSSFMQRYNGCHDGSNRNVTKSVNH